MSRDAPPVRRRCSGAGDLPHEAAALIAWRRQSRRSGLHLFRRQPCRRRRKALPHTGISQSRCEGHVAAVDDSRHAFAGEHAAFARGVERKVRRPLPEAVGQGAVAGAKWRRRRARSGEQYRPLAARRDDERCSVPRYCTRFLIRSCQRARRLRGAEGEGPTPASPPGPCGRQRAARAGHVHADPTGWNEPSPLRASCVSPAAQFSTPALQGAEFPRASVPWHGAR